MGERHHGDEGMNEIELVRRAMPEMPLDEAGAQERARARLQIKIDQAERDLRKTPEERRRRPRHPLRWGAAAAAVIAAVLAAQAILPPRHGGPAVSAASQLRQLSRLAATRSVTIPEGSYLFSSMEDLGIGGGTELTQPGSVDGVVNYDLWVRNRSQFWQAADGSGHLEKTVLSSSFVSPADHEAWLDAGSPPLPQPGKVTTEDFGPGEIKFYDLTQAPTDPEALTPLIRGDDLIEHDPGIANTLYAIGTLLAQGTASAELRAGLLQVAASLPGVRSLGTVTDPLGRSGIGFAASRGDVQAELIFDPDTSVLLAQQRRALAGEQAGSLLEWQAYTGSGIVDQIGEIPGG